VFATTAGTYTIDAASATQFATGAYTIAVSCGGTQPPVLSGAASAGQVALSWTACSGATSYTIERGTTSGGPYTPLATVTGTSYTDTTIAVGTTYYYVAYATYPAGQSALSNEVEARQAAVIPIDCGQTLTGSLAGGSIDQYGDYTQTYSFAGTAGETVSDLHAHHLLGLLHDLWSQRRVCLPGSAAAVYRHVHDRRQFG
jgi:hypothetical protein